MDNNGHIKCKQALTHLTVEQNIIRSVFQGGNIQWWTLEATSDVGPCAQWLLNIVTIFDRNQSNIKDVTTQKKPSKLGMMTLAMAETNDGQIMIA